MRTLLAAVLLMAVLLSWGCRESKPEPEARQQLAESRAEEAGMIPLRILYVGLPDTERQDDFVAFLREHFEQVDTADYNAFAEEQTKDWDVAILDKDGVEWKSLDIDVSSEYSRATVTLGVPGAFWVRRVSQNMGYM